MSITYAKGSKPQDLEAACGGEVLDRVKSFIKDPDQFHPDGAGMAGPDNKQDYAKGSGAGRSNRTGNKSLPVIKPRS